MALPAIFVFVASLIVSLASSSNARHKAQRARRKAEAALQNAQAQGQLVNAKSSEFRYPLAYGRCRLGGNRIYRATSGSGDRYYHQILNIGMGPMEGIVRQDGTIYTTTGSQLPTGNPPLIYLDGELWTDTNMVGKCYFEWFNGADDQNICSTLSVAVPQWNLAQRHKAYLYMRLDYDRDKFLGVPDVTVVVAGLQCYDPTADAVAYTENFALHAYDMLTRPKVLGGLGLDNWMAAPPTTPRVDVDSVEACRSYCAAKGWTGGMPVNVDRDFVENVAAVLDNFRGDIITSANTFKMVLADLNYESTVMDLEESDIVRREAATQLKIRPAASTFRLPNALTARHYAGELNYISHDYFYADTAAIAADDGDVRKADIDMMGLNDLNTLQAMCSYQLERQRWGNLVSFEGRQKLMQLEPHDVITLTHALPGYAAQKLRVQSVGLSSAGTIAVTAIEEADNLYDDTYNPATLVRYVPPVVNLSDPPPSVYNVTISEATEVTRLRTFTKLLVDFDPPAEYPWFDYAKVWLKKGTGAWKYITKAESDWEYALVQEGETYYVTLQSVNVAGVAEPFEAAYTAALAVQGLLTTSPANVTGFIAAATGDSVVLRANDPNPNDNNGWEVRLGDAWDGGLFVTRLNAPSKTFSGVRPGTHTFWMAQVSNAEVYSPNPVSATAVIYIPSGLTSDFSQTWDYTSGTFNNAAQDTYNSQNVLKCSHTGGVLAGDWTGPTYDRGGLAVVRVWVEFDSVFLATTSTWGGVLPSPNTWADAGVDTKTWAQIFQPTSAAQFKATLRYSENGSDWSELTGFELHFFEVYARYFQVKIEIVDPTADANLYIYPITMKSYTGPV